MATVRELLTAADMAAIVKTTPATIVTWAHKGIIPSIKINRRVIRYDAVEVIEALQKCSIEKGGVK